MGLGLLKLAAHCANNLIATGLWSVVRPIAPRARREAFGVIFQRDPLSAPHAGIGALPRFLACRWHRELRFHRGRLDRSPSTAIRTNVTRRPSRRARTRDNWTAADSQGRSR